jgi:thiamine pyrophosphate-dependent acetolactate synthase large subunit-like protein
LADLLGAPVAKALLGKAVLPDDSPFTTGGIGSLGTEPSSWIMKNCDTVAKACGADGFRCEKPDEVRPALQAAFASKKPAIVEAIVDAEEKPTKPHELKV